MTLPEPRDVIAPREPDDWVPKDFVREMFIPGAHPHGTVLEYHGLKLQSKSNGRLPIWDVYTADGTYVETLNLGAFKTVTAVLEALDELREEQE